MSCLWNSDWEGLRSGFWGGTRDHQREVSGMGLGRSGSHQSVAMPSRKVIIPYKRNIHAYPLRPPSRFIFWNPAETRPTTAAESCAAVKYQPIRWAILLAGYQRVK